MSQEGQFQGAVEVYFNVSKQKKDLDTFFYESLFTLLMLCGVFLLLFIAVLKIYVYSDQKRTEIEKLVQDQANFLKNVMDSLTHPFYVIDAKTYEILLCNDHPIFGENWDKKPCHQTIYQKDTPCHDGPNACPIKEVLNTKNHVQMEHRVTDKEGTLSFHLKHGYPVLDEKQEVQSVIVYSIDITKEKQIQNRLVQSEKMASLGTIASGIAHELKNPLASILGFADISLRDENLDSKTHDTFFKSQDAGSRMKVIIDY